MSWVPGAALLSKLFCSLVLAVILLQYMFGTVGHLNRRWETYLYTNPLNATITNNRYRGSESYTDHYSVLPTSTISYDGNITVPYGNITAENMTSQFPLCPPVPPDLTGRVEIRKIPVPLVQELEKNLSWLKAGGHFTPTNCQARNRVAIIVPYRSRAEHLLIFLQHMHPFLKRQQIEYTIFIIEQDGDGPFNRAMLFNVGFKEALKVQEFDCFVFHDVDLLPEDDRNLYTCPEQPRHMSVAVNVFRYRLPYAALFGGVSAMTKEQFTTVNGFSNSFWGWGGEDDDMSNRIKFHSYHISRYPVNIARYTMLTHQKEKANPKRFENLQHGKKKFNSDGLVNLKYEVVQSRANLLYTWFLVNLRKPS